MAAPPPPAPLTPPSTPPPVVLQEPPRTPFDTLKLWEDIRKARDTNEKMVSEVMLENMEAKLETGKNSCNELLKYVKEIASIQRVFVANFSKLGTSLDERLYYGTLEYAVVVMKKQNMIACDVYEEHNKVLIENIAAQLSNLSSEYAKLGSKILEIAKKLGKDLDQQRDTTSKLFSLYVAAYDECVAAEKAGNVPTRDPWMAERSYHQSLSVGKAEKDKFATEMGQLFERFLKLEEKRIESTKAVLQLHVSKQKLMLGKLLEGITELSAAVESVNTVSDKQQLIQTNFNRQDITASLLQQQQQQLSSSQDANPLQAPNPALVLQHNQLQAQVAGLISTNDLPKFVSEPVKTGHLFRQSSVIKSWKRNYFVLTPGFLYIFVTNEENTPEYTLQLANVSLQFLQNFEEPHVFELIVNPNSFFSSVKYVFKAENEQTRVEWMAAITKCSGLKK